MAVGQLVKKFTWLLDNVEVKGVVRRGSAPDGTDLWEAAHAQIDGDNSTDWLDIVPDANYAHLITGGSSGHIHFETYVELVTTDPGRINRIELYPIVTKPKQAFQALNPITGLQQNLKVGDHVRVVGRWVIDHHPEKCVTRDRGWLRIGCAHIEFHPFRWDTMTLVTELKPSDIQEEILSLAAPLHEEVYLGGWKWAANEVAGVASKIFVADDGSNYHDIVTASASIKAPPLPAGFTPNSSLIQFQEQVLRNGTGLSASLVHSMVVVNDGIEVTARVVAPGTQRAGSLLIGDVNDPANNKSIFQARYTVQWKPRLIAVDSPSLVGAQLETVRLAPQATGGSYTFLIYLANRGPDPLEITKIEVKDDPDSVFIIDPAITFPLPVLQMSVLPIRATFSPKKAGSVTAKFLIYNNDPVQEILSLELTSAGIGDLAQVEVSPLSVDFGSVKVGTIGSSSITVRNTGNVEASVSEMTMSPASIFQPPTVNQRQTLSLGQSQVTDIFYAPTQRGASQGSGKLMIQGTSSVSQEIDIALKGQGIAPIIVLDPPIMDFGAVPVGTSQTLPLRILNNGDASLTVNTMPIVLSTGRAFLLDPAQVFPFSVAPTSPVTLQVTYNAGPTPGQAHNDEWEVESDDPINPSVRLLLRGMAGGPRIDVLPDFIDFHHLQLVPALSTTTKII